MRYISISALVLSATLAAAQTSPAPGQPESLFNPDFALVRSKVASALTSTGTCKFAPGGGSCPQNAPCCSGAGYCGSDPAFCADNCQATGSFAADSCWPLPMAVNLDDQFKDKSRIVNIKDFNGFPTTADWVVDRTPGTREHAVITDDDKLVLKLNRVEKHPETGGGIGATVHSSRWMKYGTIEARIKTASSMPGTVSSFIMISPISGDEIDFEIVGRDPSDVQTNFYYRVQPGHEVDYTNGMHINVNLDTSLDYHTYRLDWTPTEMKWWFDGELKRTTLASQVVGKYPDTPMRIAFGIWDGGYGSKGKTLFPVDRFPSAASRDSKNVSLSGTFFVPSSLCIATIFYGFILFPSGFTFFLSNPVTGISYFLFLFQLPTLITFSLISVCGKLVWVKWIRLLNVSGERLG